MIVNLTSIVVLAKEMPTWLEEAPRLGWRVASMRFGLEFLVQATILSIVNTLLVALPVAGAIYYFRFLAERRSP